MRFLRRSEKVLKPLGEMIPRSPEEMSRQERRLTQAGIRRRDAPYLLNGAKLALAILFFLVFTMIGAYEVEPSFADLIADLVWCHGS